jgi:uncharacterized protein DUF4360
MVRMAGLCAALLSCLAFAPAAASAAPSQQPPHYTVRLLTANGTGCPPGSATVRKVNSTEFTIRYRDYRAFAGGGVSPALRRLNCQLNVQVSVPSGWTYRLLQVDNRGHADLDRGAKATIETDYWFEGSPVTQQQQHWIYGPKDYNYTINNPVATSWAPCHFNGALEISTSVRVSPGSRRSFINEVTLDSTRIGPINRIGFKRC